jgi:hypothetical protein
MAESLPELLFCVVCFLSILVIFIGFDVWRVLTKIDELNRRLDLIDDGIREVCNTLGDILEQSDD